MKQAVVPHAPARDESGLLDAIRRLAPGIGLCAAIALAAQWLQGLTEAMGWHWADAFVLAILLGMAARLLWTPGRAWQSGIDFSVKQVLEISVVLLGATFNVASVLQIGMILLCGAICIVGGTIVAGFLLGRAAGLSPRVALLVACGTAICGNSAIVAIAPVIGASRDDVAASLTFTAILGLGLVLALPVAAVLLHVPPLRYGMLAGLTIYAVPQVLAAASPLGAVAIQIATITKLVRVLMLAPASVVLSLVGRRLVGGSDEAGDRMAAIGGRPALWSLVPWFILGFLATLAARSLGLFPEGWLPAFRVSTHAMMLMAIAALGVNVDFLALAETGGRVVAAAFFTLLAMVAMSVLFLWFAGLG